MFAKLKIHGEIWTDISPILKKPPFTNCQHLACVGLSARVSNTSGKASCFFHRLYLGLCVQKVKVAKERQAAFFGPKFEKGLGG